MSHHVYVEMLPSMSGLTWLMPQCTCGWRGTYELDRRRADDEGELHAEQPDSGWCFA